MLAKDPTRENDALCEDFGCSRLYGTCPNKVYYVIDISEIIGPAPITPDPLHPTIPYGAFDNMSQARRKREYQDARTDSRKGNRDGSPLYIVIKWAFEWGPIGLDRLSSRAPFDMRSCAQEFYSFIQINQEKWAIF